MYMYINFIINYTEMTLTYPLAAANTFFLLLNLPKAANGPVAVNGGQKKQMK